MIIRNVNILHHQTVRNFLTKYTLKYWYYGWYRRVKVLCNVFNENLFGLLCITWYLISSLKFRIEHVNEIPSESHKYIVTLRLVRYLIVAWNFLEILKYHNLTCIHYSQLINTPGNTSKNLNIWQTSRKRFINFEDI